MRPLADKSDRHTRLLALSLLWLLAGSALLASTLVPAYTEWLGWTPLFWLFVAPLAVSLTLQPRWPKEMLRLCKPRRRAASSLIWN